MSYYERTYGFIAVIKNLPELPTTDYSDDIWETWFAKFEEDNSILSTNYNVDLISCNFLENANYQEKEDVCHLSVGSNMKNKNKFLEELKKYEIEIDESTVRPYTCVYYNGADNPVKDMAKEEFLTYE